MSDLTIVEYYNDHNNVNPNPLVAKSCLLKLDIDLVYGNDPFIS